MRLKKLHIISAALLAGIAMTILSSYSTGITGRSTVGCTGSGCHGAQSANTVIAVSGIPTGGWVPGTSYPLTLTVTNTTKVAAGFNLTVNVGTLTAGTGMTINGTQELRHSTPKNLVSGTTSWSFSWVAPSSGSTALTLDVACNAVNLNGSADANDNWNQVSLNYTAAATATAPTVTSTAATAITTTSATANGTVNANGANATVTIEYGTTTSYGSTVNATPNTVTGTTVTTVSGALSGLLPATLYHYRVKAVNSAGTTNGGDMTFTTLAAATAPAVVTTAATAITSNGASANGTVNANGANATVTIEYGTTTSYGSTANATPATVSGNTVTNVTAALSGLLPSTLYHYRVKAVNSVGTTNGTDMTFTTTAPSPTVITAAATGITTTGATANGTVNANGANATVTIEYGTTVAYGNVINATPNTVTGTTVTNVSAAITGLLSGTLYHYRVKAVSSAGTSTGGDITFTTTVVTAAPTAVTTAATGVTLTGATVNGMVTANNAIATVIFEYGTTTAYGSIVAATPATVSGGTATNVSGVITGLLSGTTYHYRVSAVNGLGTTNGADMTFTTATPAPPAVVTTFASSITSNSATANGTVNANGDVATVQIEYGTTTAYGSTVNATPNQVTGNIVASVAASLTGLLPSTLYHYRVKATSGAGTATGADMTFTTLSLTGAPRVLITGATGVSGNGATLNGTVNANSATTDVVFEYGLTASYGSTITASPNPVNGSTPTAVSAVLTGLLPSRLYHYRIKAINSFGTIFSPDATFSTTTLAIGTISNTGYSVYPNPATNQLVLTVKEGASLNVYAVALNGSRQLLSYKQITPGQYAVDITALAEGNYLLVVNTADQSFTTPFVKQ